MFEVQSEPVETTQHALTPSSSSKWMRQISEWGGQVSRMARELAIRPEPCLGGD